MMMKIHVLAFVCVTAGIVNAAQFLDRFHADTSANYVGTRTSGSGGSSFNVTDGSLNIVSANATTFCVFHSTAQLQEGEVMSVVSYANNPVNYRISVSTIPRGPNTGTESGIRFYVPSAVNMRAQVYSGGVLKNIDHPGVYPLDKDLTFCIFRTTKTKYSVGYFDGTDLVILNDSIEIPQTANVTGLYVGVEAYSLSPKFDDLQIQSISDFLAVGQAHSPNPDDGQINVPLNTILSWNKTDDYTPLKEVLYFREAVQTTEPNWPAGAIVVDPVTDLNWDDDPQTTEAVLPMALEYGTTYWWRVDSYEPNEIGSQVPICHTGKAWHFISARAIAEIVAHPSDQTVAAGSAAQFVVSANLTTQGYQWYKNDQALTNGGNISGSNSPVLTIENVMLADEGYYHCVVSNDIPSQAASLKARLMTRRLVGHWKFDGNLNNEIISGLDAVIVSANPELTPTIGFSAENEAAVGTSALTMNNIDGDTTGWLTIPGSGELYNFPPQGITVNAWVKTARTGYQGLLGKRVGSEAAGFNLLATNNSPYAAFALRNPGDAGIAADTTVSINNDQWHMITGVLRQVNDGLLVELYVDGIRRDTKGPHPVSWGSASDLFIGANRADGTNLLTGMIDDLKIFCYPLTMEEIADEYKAVVPGILCIDPTFEGYQVDFDGNCVVNLADFAAMAQAWLATGLY